MEPRHETGGVGPEERGNGRASSDQGERMCEGNDKPVSVPKVF
jgi:hypothetical protein